MTISKNRQKNAVICIWIGLQLICFALFLHPMSPQDFLSLAINAPLETLSQSQGFAMSIGFWIGLLVVAIGSICWIDAGIKFKKSRQTKACSSSKFWLAR